MGFFKNAIRSIPEAPLVLYSGNIIEESKAGVCLTTFDEDLFCHELSRLSDLDSSTKRILGENGKSYFLNKFDSSANLEKLHNILVGKN